MRRLRDGLRTLAYSNPLYALSLGGKAPMALTIVPPDSWPGNGDRGTALIEGRFPFAGQCFEAGRGRKGTAADEPPWLAERAATAWIDALHGFDWLRDLRTVSGDAARRQARHLVLAWINRFSSWHAVAWAPEVLGTRIANWIGVHDFYCSSADDAFRGRVFESLARQTRHLARVIPNAPTPCGTGTLRGAALLAALKGLIYGGLCLPGHEALRDRALRLLDRHLPQQILPDGGHVERCPETHLAVLRHLVDIRALLRVARLPVSETLQGAIDHLTLALRFFRHGDGGLALFNGSNEGDPGLIDMVINHADVRGRLLKSAAHTGFERLLAGRTLVLMDTGVPPPPGLDMRAHAGTLGFELSVGKERMIVNCGMHPSFERAWRGALAATAAHSTLTLAETNSAEVRDAGGLGRRPQQVLCERVDTDGAVLVEASHDGYVSHFGLRHRRRLYLADNGDDLRGEDTLELAVGRPVAGHLFTIRFHLHPETSALLTSDGEAVLLRLPSGIGWRLRASGASIDLSDSIYLGQGGEPRHSQQVVLFGHTLAGNTTVKWALRREKKGA